MIRRYYLSDMDSKLIEKVYRLRSEHEHLTEMIELMSAASQTSLRDPSGSFGLHLSGSVAGREVVLNIKRDVYTCIEMALKDRREQIQYELDKL